MQLTYFKKPRPVYEFYDLDADASEPEKLSGRPEAAAVEREHRLALAERMILDFDHLPLPDVMEPTAGAGGKKVKATSNGKKQSWFQDGECGVCFSEASRSLLRNVARSGGTSLLGGRVRNITEHEWRSCPGRIEERVLSAAGGTTNFRKDGCVYVVRV